MWLASVMEALAQWLGEVKGRGWPRWEDAPTTLAPVSPASGRAASAHVEIREVRLP